MASISQTITHDDITGEPGATRVTFFDASGVQHEIDLKGGVLANFRKSEEARNARLAQFIEAGRKVGKASQTPRAARGQGKSGQASQSSVIRAWAVANGVEVGSRGRLAPTVIEAYNAAHAG